MGSVTNSVIPTNLLFNPLYGLLFKLPFDLTNISDVIKQTLNDKKHIILLLWFLYALKSICQQALPFTGTLTQTYSHRAYLRWLHEEESHDDAQLEQYEEEGNDELSAGRHEARFLCTDLLFAACQDPSDAVCLQSGHKHH